MTPERVTDLHRTASTLRGLRALLASRPATRFCAVVAAGAFVSACWPGGALIVPATFALLCLVSAAAGTLLGVTDVFRLVLAATILGATLGVASQFAVAHAASLGVAARAPLPPNAITTDTTPTISGTTDIQAPTLVTVTINGQTLTAVPPAAPGRRDLVRYREHCCLTVPIAWDVPDAPSSPLTPTTTPQPPDASAPPNAASTTTIAPNARSRSEGSKLSIATKVTAPAGGRVVATMTSTVRITGVARAFKDRAYGPHQRRPTRKAVTSTVTMKIVTPPATRAHSHGPCSARNSAQKSAHGTSSAGGDRRGDVTGAPCASRTYGAAGFASPVQPRAATSDSRLERRATRRATGERTPP